MSFEETTHFDDKTSTNGNEKPVQKISESTFCKFRLFYGGSCNSSSFNSTEDFINFTKKPCSHILKYLNDNCRNKCDLCVLCFKKIEKLNSGRELFKNSLNEIRFNSSLYYNLLIVIGDPKIFYKKISTTQTPPLSDEEIMELIKYCDNHLRTLKSLEQKKEFIELFLHDYLYSQMFKKIFCYEESFKHINFIFFLNFFILEYEIEAWNKKYGAYWSRVLDDSILKAYLRIPYEYDFYDFPIYSLFRLLDSMKCLLRCEVFHFVIYDLLKQLFEEYQRLNSEILDELKTELYHKKRDYLIILTKIVKYISPKAFKRAKEFFYYPDGLSYYLSSILRNKIYAGYEEIEKIIKYHKKIMRLPNLIEKFYFLNNRLYSSEKPIPISHKIIKDIFDQLHKEQSSKGNSRIESFLISLRLLKNYSFEENLISIQKYFRNYKKLFNYKRLGRLIIYLIRPFDCSLIFKIHNEIIVSPSPIKVGLLFSPDSEFRLFRPQPFIILPKKIYSFDCKNSVAKIDIKVDGDEKIIKILEDNVDSSHPAEITYISGFYELKSNNEDFIVSFDNRNRKDEIDKLRILLFSSIRWLQNSKVKLKVILKLIGTLMMFIKIDLEAVFKLYEEISETVDEKIYLNPLFELFYHLISDYFSKKQNDPDFEDLLQLIANQRISLVQFCEICINPRNPFPDDFLLERIYSELEYDEYSVEDLILAYEFYKNKGIPKKGINFLLLFYKIAFRKKFTTKTKEILWFKEVIRYFFESLNILVSEPEEEKIVNFFNLIKAFFDHSNMSIEKEDVMELISITSNIEETSCKKKALESFNEILNNLSLEETKRIKNFEIEPAVINLDLMINLGSNEQEKDALPSSNNFSKQ